MPSHIIIVAFSKSIKIIEEEDNTFEEFIRQEIEHFKAKGKNVKALEGQR